MNIHYLLGRVLWGLADLLGGLSDAIQVVGWPLVWVTKKHLGYRPAAWLLRLASAVRQYGALQMANQPPVNTLLLVPWYSRGPIGECYDTTLVLGWSSGWFVRQTVHHFPGDAPERIREIALIALRVAQRRQVERPGQAAR
jgi:hypothetical protein